LKKKDSIDLEAINRARGDKGTGKINL